MQLLLDRGAAIEAGDKVVIVVGSTIVLYCPSRNAFIVCSCFKDLLCVLGLHLLYRLQAHCIFLRFLESFVLCDSRVSVCFVVGT